MGCAGEVYGLAIECELPVVKGGAHLEAGQMLGQGHAPSTAKCIDCLVAIGGHLRHFIN
jgi:hypothetical protein